MQFEVLTDKGTPVKLVRFFTLNGKKFLIYSDANDSTDEQGHLTIHISEINSDDRIVANTVSDADWDAVKNIIKGIVNANKNGQPLPIEDLDYNTIDGVNIVDNRSLKLMANYVDLLKQNQPLFEKKIVDNIITPSSETSVSTDNASILDSNVFNQSISIDSNASSNTQENNSLLQSDNSFSTTDGLNVSIANNSNTFSENASLDNNSDYKKMYEEQLELVNKLQNELSNYKNIVETIKNIINN